MKIRSLSVLWAVAVLVFAVWGQARADMRGVWDIDTYQVGAAICSGQLEVRSRTPEGGYLGRLILRYRTPAEHLEVQQDVALTRSGELWAVDGRDPAVSSNATLSRGSFGYQADRFLCADIWPELLECVTVRVGLAEGGQDQVPVRMTKDD